MQRTKFSDLEWNGKSVLDLDHAELLQLCERLHELVWASAENFEAVIANHMKVHAEPERVMQ